MLCNDRNVGCMGRNADTSCIPKNMSNIVYCKAVLCTSGLQLVRDLGHVNNTTFDDIEMSYGEMLEVTGGPNDRGNTDGDNGELVSDMYRCIGVNGKKFTDETSSGEENDGETAQNIFLAEKLVPHPRYLGNSAVILGLIPLTF